MTLVVGLRSQSTIEVFGLKKDKHYMKCAYFARRSSWRLRLFAWQYAR